MGTLFESEILRPVLIKAFQYFDEGMTVPSTVISRPQAWLAFPSHIASLEDRCQIIVGSFYI